jgi:ParB-like chromosome segregation protein Spo0J
MEGQEFDALVADIAAHGLREPIVLFEGKILDGRNRYRACIAAGEEPRFEAYEGDDPLAFVISLNLKRRHMNESQRAMIAAKLATLKDGQRQVGKFAEVPTQHEAATLLNVGERSLRNARSVLDHGTPELIHAVEQGKIAVSAAAALTQKTPEYQKAVVEKVLEGANRC